jgi:hypothetical protein
LNPFVRNVVANVVANLIGGAVLYGLAQLFGLLPPNQVATTISVIVVLSTLIALLGWPFFLAPDTTTRVNRGLEMTCGALLVLSGLFLLPFGAWVTYLPGDQYVQVLVLGGNILGMLSGLAYLVGRVRVRRGVTEIWRKG